MKTFEEAITCSMQLVPVEQGPEIAVERIAETQSRYRELSDEAANNPVLQQAIVAWYEHGQCNGAGSALFTAFVSGMVTGIEMEKQP